MVSLPKWAHTKVELLKNESHSKCPISFLDLRHLSIKITQKENNSEKEEHSFFVYDCISRASLHGVVVLAYALPAASMGSNHLDAEPRVYLRTAIRPPLFLASQEVIQWELCAGLIDEGENALSAAKRELEEELGFIVSENQFVSLAYPTFPSSAVIPESLTFFSVEVDPKAQRPPSEDDSVLERRASLMSRPLSELLKACDQGKIVDTKTELGLRRFAQSRKEI